jgi:geranylgeranyl pyrophosphate synthase
MPGSEQAGGPEPGGAVISIDRGARAAGPGRPGTALAGPAAAGVAQLSEMVRHLLEEQWSQRAGLVDSICRYALLPAGKLFRPVLLLESTAAVGGELAGSLPAAAGAECGHVASLIHDDIIDGDDLRRGRASVPFKYGMPDAIVAGDALIFRLFAGLAECRGVGVPDSYVVSALDAVARAGIDLCHGQALESELCGNEGSTIAAYVQMARLKTGALFRSACECGAILGGGPPLWVSRLASYGEHLGLAFQIRDDLLPYTSDSLRTGKRATSDIQNRRWTLPVILAYQNAGPAERQAISQALSGGGDSARAFGRLTEVLSATGAVGKAAEMARGYAETSLNALAVLPASASRGRLERFAELVIERDF